MPLRAKFTFPIMHMLHVALLSANTLQGNFFEGRVLHHTSTASPLTSVVVRSTPLPLALPFTSVA